MKFLITIFLLSSLNLVAQQDLESVEKSDPASIKTLAKLKSEYDKYDTHRIEFLIEIEIPGQSKENQSGSLIQSGEKFVLEMDQQMIISDNETVWIYLKDQNEIQINDADFGEEGDLMSPTAVFNLYMSDDYIYGVSNSEYIDGIVLTSIEGKPIADDSEYSKIKIVLSDKDTKLKQIKIFEKDGSRYTLNVSKHIFDYQTDSTTFTFNKNDYKGVIIEDLRF